MRTRLFGVVALGLALLLLLTGGTAAQTPVPGSTVAQAPVPGSTIVVAMAYEPDTLYYYGGSSMPLAQQHVTQAFLDGPIDNRTFDYQPVILDKLPSLDDGDAITQTVTVHAGEWYVDEWGNVVMATQDITATQIVATFSLKTGILWSDGQPLTTADSVFGFQVDCHPDTPTYKYTCERTASYQAVSDQVAVWTSLPGYFDPEYFIHFWTPLPEHLLGSMTPKEILESDYGRHPLGWGAFVVDEWIAGQYISLSRNPNYWQAGLPHVDHLVFRFIPDPDQALQALLRGEVHLVTSDATGQSRAQVLAYLDLEAQGVLDAHFTPTTWWEHIDFDIQPTDGRPAFFAGPEVRQAVAYGTNRQKMVDDILYGQSLVSHSFVPPQNPYYPPAGVLTEYPYEPDTARALLESVGWRDDDGDGIREAHGVVYQVPTWDWSAGTYGPTQTVTIPDGTPFEVTFKTTQAELRYQTGAQLQQDLAAVGISVTLEYLPGRHLFDPGPDGPLYGRKFDLAEYAWLFGVEPACELYQAWNISDWANGWSGQNPSGWVNQPYDEACYQALHTLSASQRALYFYEAQRLFSERLPVLPLLYRVSAALGNSNLLNVQLDPTAVSDLWNVEAWELSSHGQATPEGGGGVQSNDGRTTVTLGPGDVAETVTLTLTPWVVVPGGSLAGIGHAFDLTAVYASTGEPASLVPGNTFDLEIHYGDAELTTPVREETLALYYWDGDEWVVEPSSSVDPANNVVTATPDHFSLWAVLGETNRVYLPIISRNY